MMFGGGGPGGHGQMLLRQEARKAKDTRVTLVRLLRYFLPYRAILAGVLAAIILSTFFNVVTPYLLGQAIDCYIAPTASSQCVFTANPSPDIGSLMTIVTAMAVMALLAAGISGAQFYLMAVAGQRVVRRLRDDAFDQIHRLSVRYFVEHEAGDVMSRLSNDVDTISQMVNFGLVRMVTDVLSIIGIVLAMLALNTSLALVSLLVIPAMFAVTVFLSDLARCAFRQTRLEMGSVTADLQESISGVREAQAFNREDENIEQFRLTNEANRQANVRAVGITSALMPTLTVLSYVATAIVAGMGGVLVVRGQPMLGQIVTVGVIVAFLNYVGRFYQPIQSLAQLWTQIQSALAGAERIFELLDERPDILDTPQAKPLPPIQGRVEFRNVSFAYQDARDRDEVETGRRLPQAAAHLFPPDRAAQLQKSASIPVHPRPEAEPNGLCVVCDVNLVAEPGQVVALVGPTGAGKTTLINLIPRFYDVTEGAVLIDGHDVRTVTQESLRNQIGVVLQDTFLFSATVRENIRYGRPEATDAEVEEAAHISLAHEFIQRLPDGYDTMLGERGNNLSQGQRQLIAIARAALANPRILILDEATSSVDTRTERLIQKALGDLMQGRTSFVVAHRLSTIRNADQVLVVMDRQIVERGTHQELLAKRGRYYELYTSNTLARREEL